MKFATKVAARVARVDPARRCLESRHHANFHRLNFSTSRSLKAISSLDRESNEGRNVIVTGSSRGIGKSIALRLAADGFNVCINDIGANSKGCDEVVKQIKSMGRQACSAIGDVSKRDEVAHVVQTSVKELGPLNTMSVITSASTGRPNPFSVYTETDFPRVANAGIAQVKALLDLTDEDFQRMFAVNVFGVQNCYAEAAKQMITQGNCTAERPGKIIGAASIVAFKPFPLLSHYSAAKWAVRGLTQAYAMELSEHNITVNAYAPGIVGTAMWDLIDAELAKKSGQPKGEMIKKYVKDLTALGRVSVPEDVAKLVSFLAGSDSDFVTGQTQVVDGGIIYT